MFFPAQDKFIASFMLFSIFALGFLVRPIGGIVYGRLADRLGRKRIFLISLLQITIAALAIASLPTYNQIGRLSPMLLLIFRITQGFAIGGEYPIVVTYLTEISPVHRTGFFSSFVNVTSIFGVLLATAIVEELNHILSQESMYTWGWRIPFLISAFFLAFIIFARSTLKESDEYNSSRGQQLNIMDVVLDNKRSLTSVFLVVIGAAVAYYSYNVFAVSYFANTLGFTFSQSLMVSFFSSLLLMVLIPIAGLLSDIFGKRKIIIISTAAFMILSYPLYLLLSLGSIYAVVATQALFAVMLSLYLGPLPAFMSEQYETNTRCFNVAVAYNTSLALFGGTAAIVNLYLINHLHTSAAPGIYLAIATAVSFLAVCFIKNPTKSDRYCEFRE